MAQSYLLQNAQRKHPPVETALFDLFKIGPGPSSSHTIGPMKAGADFAKCCAELPQATLSQATCVHVTLFGSLSATGSGHGTDVAVLAGLLGNTPENCPPTLLPNLKKTPSSRHKMCLGNYEIPVGLADIEFGPLQHSAPYSNTLHIALSDASGKSLFDKEYYSVGGGFLQWKGWTPPERGKPVHPYGTMRELSARLQETGLALHELILENEMAITGMGRPAIYEQLESIMDAMYDSVRRGLAASGRLPGTLGVWRKAGGLWERAKSHSLPIGKGMCLLNAYAFAVAEENAAGGVIVTAPTCGAAGVMPALLYAMRNDLNVGERALREGLLASAAVGMLAKHNAGIAGAEVGCQGEIGVASAMAAAMLAHARGYTADVVENAAEIALEHHLGLTCDPVGGYVQIPCIERNAMGAIKAGNAVLLATSEENGQHLVSLDAAIMAMGEIGREMNVKFKETSKGGLAVSMVEC
ncbi:MAG: L-serine ammonia-lyase [Desulfovibrio sp.]|nr:L-serine ammonia-lyase [Desulfovibrio sp.]